MDLVRGKKGFENCNLNKKKNISTIRSTSESSVIIEVF